MTRPSSWSAVPWRWVLGATVLGAVVWRTGTRPLVTGIVSLDVRTLVLGAGVAVPTTVACPQVLTASMRLGGGRELEARPAAPATLAAGGGCRA